MIYHDWIAILHDLRQKRQHCVLITVLKDRGSVPRDGGAKMVVTDSETFLTIGGGHLEFQCIAQARALLEGESGVPIPKSSAWARDWGSAAAE